MSFKKAIENFNTDDTDAYTANGAVTNASTKNDVLDLFAIIATQRGKNISDITGMFDASYAMNRKLTLQMLLWLRDVRGGAGERGTFRELMLHLEQTHPDDVIMMIPYIPEVGRWDDLLIFKTEKVLNYAIEHIAGCLKYGENSLCAKWMPRIYKMKKGDNHSVANTNRKENNRLARLIMAQMGLNEKEYRKMLSSQSKTVESQMCDNKWDEVQYSSVPSVAMTRYLAAFGRHDEERFTQFSNDLANGVVSVNAGALFPYDLTRRVSNDVVKNAVLDAQWKSLPDLIKPGTKILPMCDTSSSMDVSAGGTKMSCLDVAMSLSMYIADKQEGEFADTFLTFSTKPRIFTLSGTTMSDKFNDMQKYRAGSYWDGSTDIGLAFESILALAKRSSIQPEDMPEMLIVFSDMEFNATNWNGVQQNSGAWSVTAYEYAKTLYKQSGYELPKIVFWNLNGRPGNNPVTANDDGSASVSGFSPAVLKSLLSGVEFNPVQIMLETIDIPRYKTVN